MNAAAQLTFQFCGLPFEIEDGPRQQITPDRAVYRERCGWRWDREALRDALGNWKTWREIHDELERALRVFARNPGMADGAGKWHNPDGTLTGFLWKLQEAWEPNRGTFYPLLGFCDHYQTVHLSRGLLIYCGMVLDSIRGKEA
jgi:hypothetical protein